MVVKTVADIPLRLGTQCQLIDLVADLVRRDPRIGDHIHFVNAFTISCTLRNHELLSILQSSNSFCIADGKPISWWSKIRRHSPQITQLRGPDFMKTFLADNRNVNLKHYFLGGSVQTLQNLKEFFGTWNVLQIVGTESPPFKERTRDERLHSLKLIQASGADVVWIGLGTPKQDYEAEFIANHLPVTAIAIGAAFDFIAGNLQECPKILRTFGFEWLFRFTQEPRRLFKRYTIGNLRFLFALFSRDIFKRNQ